MSDVFIYDAVRTPRGRIATGRAYDHLGKAKPDKEKEGDQGLLFP